MHKEKFPTLPVPFCYRPKDTRKLNVEVEIPGCLRESGTEKQILMLNDIVLVDINVVEDALRADKSPLTLGFAETIHSWQKLTISDTIAWIVHNRIEWSNLIYLAVSRVLRINQLRRIVLDDNDTTISDIVDDIIRNKTGYKQQDTNNN